MAVQKTKPAAKKTAPTVTKVAAKKVVPAAAKPKNAKAPAVKKAVVPAAVKKAPAKKAAVAKPGKAAVTKPVPSNTKKMAAKPVAKPSPEERYRLVETAAYFIAERHDFQGNSTDHWAAAEIEIAAKLGQ